MSTRITITIPTFLAKEIERKRSEEKISNMSEFYQEILFLGMKKKLKILEEVEEKKYNPVNWTWSGNLQESAGITG